MYTITVIGAGQLGSRHLQGLANLTIPFDLHIVDPCDTSIVLAKERIREVSDCRNIIREIISHESPVTLPKTIDLAIIATTADVRMAAFEGLCKSRLIKNVILEKILFQRFVEYYEAARIIERDSIKCWVNCPRRIYPVYGELKTFFSDDSVKHMDVYGGNWGLGCNGIHFLDLLAFLSNEGTFTFDLRGLDPGRRLSKRNGFVEFSGSLRGRYGQTSFNLTSIHESQARHLIVLRGEKKSVIVDEAGGHLWKLTGNEDKLEEFSLPYQSQLSGVVAESILTTGQCGLPTYEQSSKIHLNFLKALALHGSPQGHPDMCPLT